MQERRYLLSIKEFLEGEKAEKLLEEAFCKVDSQRRKKAKGMKMGRAQAACLGAGLLLQIAVRDAIGDGSVVETCRIGCGFVQYTVSQLMRQFSVPLPLVFQYGKNGKPYFRDYPFFFNLSHSGDYVFCALSLKEVGVDIQVHHSCDKRRLAGRFFSAKEVVALAGCNDDAFFFRLWTRKEAYGKLTGEGIAFAVGANLLPEIDGLTNSRGLVWEEYHEISGYSIAVCQYLYNIRST